MRRILAILVMTAACASGRRPARECEPLPAEFQSYEVLYRACAVDERARFAARPNLQLDFSRVQPLIADQAGCYQAKYEFVIDANGMPLGNSVRLVRTNSQSYASVVRESIGTFRFKPARKNGIPVPQLYEYDFKMKYAVSSRTGPARRAPPC
jgi:hypothetical protein